MLHIILDNVFDDNALELEEQAQEQALEALTRSLLAAYGSTSTVDE